MSKETYIGITIHFNNSKMEKEFTHTWGKVSGVTSNAEITESLLGLMNWWRNIPSVRRYSFSCGSSLVLLDKEEVRAIEVKFQDKEEG